MSKKSTLNIDKKSYEKIRKYCKENSYKISAWTEKVILEKIKEIDKKD